MLSYLGSAEMSVGKEVGNEIREVDTGSRLLEVLGFARDLLRAGAVAEETGEFRSAAEELSKSLGLPPERTVDMPDNLVKQTEETGRRERLRDHITLSYYAGRLSAYEEAILPIVSEIDPQDASVMMSSYKDGDKVRVNNAGPIAHPNWKPVAERFDYKLSPRNPSDRHY